MSQSYAHLVFELLLFLALDTRIINNRFLKTSFPSLYAMLTPALLAERPVENSFRFGAS